MNCERIEELIPKVVDRQALDWEVEAVGAHLPTCAACASLDRELREIGALVRAPVARAVAEADFSGFWAKVDAGIRSSAPTRMLGVAKPKVSFGWLAFARVASAVSVAAMLALIMWLPIHQEHDFAANDNAVDVQSISGGANDTVMIQSSGKDDADVTFIWVIPETYQEPQENQPT